MSEHFGMGNRTGEVILNQFDIEADTSIEVGDRGMECRFKSLTPGCLFGHSSG
jgi:hypothetical protein